MCIDGVAVSMELDTGASVSLVSEKMFRHLWPSKVLQKSSAVLRTYTGQPLQLVGSVNVSVSYKSQQAQLSLLVVMGDGPSLFGRDWLESITLDWSEIHSLQTDPLHSLLEQHTQLFQATLGTMKGFKAKFRRN